MVPVCHRSSTLSYTFKASIRFVVAGRTVISNWKCTIYVEFAAALARGPPSPSSLPRIEDSVTSVLFYQSCRQNGCINLRSGSRMGNRLLGRGSKVRANVPDGLSFAKTPWRTSQSSKAIYSHYYLLTSCIHDIYDTSYQSSVGAS